MLGVPGAYGVVIHADTKDGYQVAIKYPELMEARKGDISSRSHQTLQILRIRLLRELMLANFLDHPNLMSARDAFTIGDAVCTVFDVMALDAEWCVCVE